MRAWQWVKEQIVPAWGPTAWTGLRTRFKIIGSKFFGSTPAYDSTIINYDAARALYLNQADQNLGAFFAKPIVDLQVDFIGLPIASTEDEDNDDFLNECLAEFWAAEIQQMMRNAIRDSKTVVRIQQDNVSELTTVDESSHARLELVDPERCVIDRDPTDSTVISRAIIKHEVEIEDEPGDFTIGELPKTRIHEILEIITPEDYRYFDTTERIELTNWMKSNTWGFVPLVEVENEHDSSLSGPHSDLETAYPLICAFHDCLSQGLQAHKYHSVPKVKLKIQDVQAFIKNNFPNVLNESGQVNPNAEVSWRGKEILFLQADEDADFLEARSVLGDTKELLSFLIDCISIASETPRWAFMIVEVGSANQSNNAQTLPWAKKILRKRKYFQKPVQDLLKMVMKINDMPVIRPKLTWEIIRVEDQFTYNQALQQLTMALEVAAARGIISDTTYRETMRAFLPNMKNPSQEKQDSEKNRDLVADKAASANPNGAGDVKNVPITAGQQGQNE
jgi:hypothetical protein